MSASSSGKPLARTRQLLGKITYSGVTRVNTTDTMLDDKAYYRAVSGNKLTYGKPNIRLLVDIYGNCAERLIEKL